MTDFTPVQRRLAAAGYNIGSVDGIAGPKTYTALLAYVAQRPMDAVAELGKALATFAPQYGIDATPARLANFVGQAAHESGGFKYLRELWGPTDVQKRYEGRADLGNTQPGDGFRFRGRGIFQLTGRANYRATGQRIGQPLEAQPDLAERPDIAVHTACDFWQSRGLSQLADSGLEDTITRRINGATNGIVERRKYVARAKGLFT